MTPRHAIAGLTVLGLLLTGCGSGHKSATSTGPKVTSARAALTRLAQCARTHGVPSFPDPVQEHDGTWNFPSSADNLKLPQGCAELKRLVRMAENSPKPMSSADLAKLRQFAECLRRSGIPDWPDPDSDGTFTLPARLRGLGKAALIQQLAPCRKYNPNKGISFKVPAAGSR